MKTESDLKEGHAKVASSSGEEQQLSEQLEHVIMQKEELLKRIALLETEIVIKEKEIKKVK